MYITIWRNNIESIVEKKDAIIVYLKSGKYWVCEKKFMLDRGGQVKLELKGKSDK